MNLDRDRLREIRTFPSLVKYLRDELDWPIDGDDFDELTFEYEPEELGIDSKTAAKIQEIKQLRPLSSGQPWGIFFVKFEPKRLPVVALRRILGQLVFRKRASANAVERQSWNKNDLLFVSNYGEGDDRQITFAHFTENEQLGDLPTLKVLGWDGGDTPLHLDHVQHELTDKLRWPADPKDLTGWRQHWAGAFTIRHREVITTSQQLALRLADLARDIRKRVNSALAVENEKGPLRKMMTAFQTALIHDLDADDFADMYAQTIAYGLLSARVSRPEGLVADNVADMVPITNPFLKELMQTFLHLGGRRRNGKNGTGIDFDELGINEVVDLLRHANMEAVLRDFGNRNPQEDPVIHFYELFLKEYDAQKRMQRGVFYTPRPVVSYIVRSVHELLQSEFGLADGLADTTTWGEMVKKHKDLKLPIRREKNPNARDQTEELIDPATPFVQILDPATGTATFLVEVIDVIHKTMLAKWKKQGHTELFHIPKLWNEYVPRYLLPRLHGYELMMAPYAIAHMKIGLKLFDTGYKFGSGERARIYLTNALEPPQDFSDNFEQMAPALAHEAKAVNDVKRYQRFTVVIGNPPYSASISEPAWLMAKMGDWKRGLNETKSDLNREEWKFLRFAQLQCTTTGAGILGFIINRDYLDGIAKRRLREHLGETFPLRIAVDLNGDVKGNISDENVFEIEQGVCISVFSTKHAESALLFCSEVGTREQKYRNLIEKHGLDGRLSQMNPTAPYFRWLPFNQTHTAGASEEYSAWFPINEVFSVKSSGIQTKNDPICIGWSKDEIFRRVQLLHSLSAVEATARLGIAEDGVWTVANAKADLQSFGVADQHVRRMLYRPFDWRFTYYTRRSSGFLGRPRYEVMQHMIGGRNLGLIFNRQIVGNSVSQFGVSRDLIAHGTFYLGNKGQDYLAPLWLHPQNHLTSTRQSNFAPSFIAAIGQSLRSDAPEAVPESTFAYIYAIFHSGSYRARYAEFLKIDFPRIPLPTNLDLFHELARLGGEVVALHLMDSPRLQKPITAYSGQPNPQVEKASYANGTVWLDKKQTIGFAGVPEAVWNFHIGGYQVCEKWLKDRKGRTLSQDDLTHYQKIVVALNETIRLMKEIDETIDKHGGWPGAFVTAPVPVK